MKRKPTRNAGNPVENAVRISLLKREINDLITMADMQASWGDSPAQTVDRCGRVLFVVSFATGRCNVPDDLPEVRILRAMCNVVEQLALDHSTLDQHRATLSSGLQAVQRLLPRLNLWSIAEGSLVLDHLLQQGHRPQVQDMEQLIKAPAALPFAA